MSGASHARLGANECPLPPPASVVEAIACAARDGGRYPDPYGVALREGIAASLPGGFTRAHVALGNGASELIDLAIAAFTAPGDEIVLCEPTFPPYRGFAENRGARVVSVQSRDHVHDLSAMASAVGPRTRLVVVVQPNNPTGTIVTRAAWRAFLDALPPGPLVVCDEAYVDYVDDPEAPDVLGEVLAGHPVVSLRTFSKAQSLAGLRVGYALAAPDVAARLEALRPRFSVSGPAQAGALAALAARDHTRDAVALAHEGKRALVPALERLGIRVVPSQANFLLVRFPEGTANVCRELALRGVEVCDLTTLGFGMAPGWARITMGRPEDHARLIEALGSSLVAA